MINLARHGFEVVGRAPAVEANVVLKGDVRRFVFIMKEMEAWPHRWPKHFIDAGFNVTTTPRSDELFRFMQEVGESSVAAVEISSKANAWLYVSHPSIKKLASKTIASDAYTDFFASILKSDSRLLKALRDYAATEPTVLMEFVKKPADLEAHP